MICDSLIFDMDGTLWDAVDSYVTVWNDTFAQLHIQDQAEPVTRQRLMGTMGKPLEEIVNILIPHLKDKEGFLKVLDHNERVMMPTLKGLLYPHVTDTLALLSRHLPLFLVSNCGSYGLQNFIAINKLTPYFRDALSHGDNGLSKAQNIKLIIDRHGLKHPYYVGDTQTDSDSARAAGAGMIWCRYGFGHDVTADYTIDSFDQLPRLVLDSGNPCAR